MYNSHCRRRELGKFRHNIDVTAEFLRIAREDEQTGIILKNAGRYRQSMYFILQAMEKYVRAKIFSMVDARNQYLRQEQRNHVLQGAVEDLIRIYSGDEHIRLQITQQLRDYVLGDIKFEYLHNDLRYPHYSSRFSSYSCFEVNEADCELLIHKLAVLKKFLDGLDRFR